MNTFRLLAVTSIIFIMGCAATPTESNEAVSNVDGVVCSRSASDMGSRLDRRTCSTKAEREEAARITREEITNRQRPGDVTSSIPTPSAGN